MTAAIGMRAAGDGGIFLVISSGATPVAAPQIASKQASGGMLADARNTVKSEV